uniref:EF-hand domain-containing protein n=1 Tax=Cyclophora tenuis TaxID=216820 RepID=A0A7S1GHL3_CYCTE|mmetsp:Transcript_12641/g.21485  ORF Transcript_12641/g.21485 Transcript_12641/m.21485 type:complete len:481 (+) Transcript_12641:35-1477(+)
MRLTIAFEAILLHGVCVGVESFTPTPTFVPRQIIARIGSSSSTIRHSFVFGGELAQDDEDNYEEDDEEDDEDDELDPYQQVAESEFNDDGAKDMDRLSLPVGTSMLDWGGEYTKLRERFEDAESGKSQNPSYALFRVMTSEPPNRIIAKFVTQAKPELVQAMSGAVGSLLGGLSNPVMGIESVVKASGDRIANLCFQLQMTGYMFRNAEYVLALKDLMNLEGSATLQEYREAFERMDEDGSGFIETTEIESLLSDVYGGDVPKFEIDSFLRFFDSNKDGKISWEEFEQGLGAMTQEQAAKATAAGLLIPPTPTDDDDDISDEYETEVQGTIEVEMEDGTIIEVEAAEYIDGLKKEAEELRNALRSESLPGALQGAPGGMVPSAPQPPKDFEGGIADYINTRQGDVKALTEGISSEILDTMKMLVDFVLDSNNTQHKGVPKEQLQMELPGSALQQLALWQLVLGYRLREAEAKGEYLRLLE